MIGSLATERVVGISPASPNNIDMDYPLPSSSIDLSQGAVVLVPPPMPQPPVLRPPSPHYEHHSIHFVDGPVAHFTDRHSEIAPLVISSSAKDRSENMLTSSVPSVSDRDLFPISASTQLSPPLDKKAEAKAKLAQKVAAMKASKGRADGAFSENEDDDYRGPETVESVSSKSLHLFVCILLSPSVNRLAFY